MSADAGQPEKKKKMSGCMLASIIGCGVLVLMMPIALIIGAIAVPNFINAVDRGKQKRSMADIRSIATAIEMYSLDNEFYPTVSDIDELGEVLVPIYIGDMPSVDGWSRPFRASSTSVGYELISSGRDGLFDDCSEGSTTYFDADICFVDGEFIQWPEGSQR